MIDEHGEPSTFQTLLETKMGEQDTFTFDAAERVLMSAAVATGTCVRHKLRFVPSDRLRNLRQRRKQVHDNATRKFLSFQIRKLHRKESRQWKATLLRKYLANPARWKELQNVSKSREKSYGTNTQTAPKQQKRQYFFLLCLGASLCNSGLLAGVK